MLVAVAADTTPLVCSRALARITPCWPLPAPRPRAIVTLLSFLAAPASPLLLGDCAPPPLPQRVTARDSCRSPATPPTAVAPLQLAMPLQPSPGRACARHRAGLRPPGLASASPCEHAPSAPRCALLPLAAPFRRRIAVRPRTGPAASPPSADAAPPCSDPPP
nr:predicted GPI-anchored protein 58 [Aegilops tauschii subsp. strangulata]